MQEPYGRDISSILSCRHAESLFLLSLGSRDESYSTGFPIMKRLRFLSEYSG